MVCALLAGLLLLCGTAFAAEQPEKELPELGMRFSLPEGYTALYRDEFVEAEGFEAPWTEEDIAQLQQQMRSGNTYLFAWPLSGAYQYTLSAQPVEAENFSRADTERLEAFRDDTERGLRDNGGENVSSAIYRSGHVRFIQSEFTETFDGVTAYVRSYMTIQDGNGINFSLVSYDQELTEEAKSEFTQFIDSVRLDSAETAETAFSESLHSSGNAGESSRTERRGGSFVVRFLLGLALTFLVSVAPMMVYRYAIRKKPVPEKQATTILIFYTFCMFVVTLLLAAYVIPVIEGVLFGTFLWCWVNFRMLTRPKEKNEDVGKDGGDGGDVGDAF